MVKQGSMRRVLTDEQIEKAVTTPPQDTRAKARAAVVRTLSENRVRYIVDWDSVYLENEHHLSFRDPFSTYEEDSASFADEIHNASKMLLDKPE
jgi:proteasome accessory factor A